MASLLIAALVLLAALFAEEMLSFGLPDRWHGLADTGTDTPGRPPAPEGRGDNNALGKNTGENAPK